MGQAAFGRLDSDIARFIGGEMTDEEALDLQLRAGDGIWRRIEAEKKHRDGQRAAVAEAAAAETKRKADLAALIVECTGPVSFGVDTRQEWARRQTLLLVEILKAVTK